MTETVGARASGIGVSIYLPIILMSLFALATFWLDPQHAGNVQWRRRCRKAAQDMKRTIS
jgi:hypothetical protein